MKPSILVPALGILLIGALLAVAPLAASELPGEEVILLAEGGYTTPVERADDSLRLQEKRDREKTKKDEGAPVKKDRKKAPRDSAGVPSAPEAPQPPTPRTPPSMPGSGTNKGPLQGDGGGPFR